MPISFHVSTRILRIKKREYRDGIKSQETRPGQGVAHNVYKACVGITEEPICAHRLHHTSPYS